MLRLLLLTKTFSRLIVIFIITLLASCGGSSDKAAVASEEETINQPTEPSPIEPKPTIPDPVISNPSTPNPSTPDPSTPEAKNIPTSIAYNGWSTMQNSLSGQNTESSTSPSASHDPSLFNLVGEMYKANCLTGYSSDFEFLIQGSIHIDGTRALDNIDTTSATVIVLSAYGGGSGILQEPANADSEGGWINRMVNAAQAAQARGITPIMFQA